MNKQKKKKIKSSLTKMLFLRGQFLFSHTVFGNSKKSNIYYPLYRFVHSSPHSFQNVNPVLSETEKTKIFDCHIFC